MFMRQRAQRGSGFLQPGQLVTLDLVGEPLTPYWLKPRPWCGIGEQLYEMDLPQKLQLTNTCRMGANTKVGLIRGKVELTSACVVHTHTLASCLIFHCEWKVEISTG